jgi:BlaI family penicillinase repressor
MKRRRRKSNSLTRRESEIMDVLYKLEKATVADVLDGLSDRRNYSTVRAQLRVLEEKRVIWHETKKMRYVYAPTLSREIARRTALRHIIDIFFDGSAKNPSAGAI